MSDLQEDKSLEVPVLRKQLRECLDGTAEAVAGKLNDFARSIRAGEMWDYAEIIGALENEARRIRREGL